MMPSSDLDDINMDPNQLKHRVLIIYASTDFHFDLFLIYK